MSRDMKSRKSTPAKKKSGGGTLIGMFIGLVLGVGVAAGVVWYMNKSPLPFVERAQPPARAEGANGQPGQPLALPGKPGDPIPEKRFQFYDILPGKADAVPDKTPKPDAKKDEAKKEEPKKEDKKEEAKESKTPLFLQAGSFSTAQDADNQKAKLAFMGIEAVVQQVMIQDKTFYRVRVGPYTKIDELNKVRAELAKSGIEAQLSK
ncbi:SPOR domain-containing protein [Ferribacterium limneticum]|uniref:SPOR domain-containing protein n=1 Tax=Ferribacterium limneticum TaxID=76259 RepID=UPI001CFB94B4|nr:SPOR domain-containing protein [Ferribacterium limneticum]UCV28189.1 SPOR domain-containing protein [Ferribacterium limneticum]UCV32106.1 SPOR domain-containing protein [Ferribacterium limneticum]